MAISIAYRRLVSMYVAVALAVALARVGLYLRLVHRYVPHTVSDAVLRLQQLEYPKEFVALHTGIASIENKVLFIWFLQLCWQWAASFS